MPLPADELEDDPLWYKDAIIYEVHVKCFYDSDNDGIGDFKGLIQKLDYLEDLGINAIWLLPFYQSPLKDDGYDISDYFKTNPDYGTLQDFKKFLKEAHKRNIRVITELVINHTSDQHPWFQRSRKSKPGTVWRDFYVWSDTLEKYRDARIIFKDFETSNWTWDPVAGAYYWHRFYSHQPDLNFDNPRVRKEIFRVIDFWMKMGVDGLRLDAVPYLFEREGTNCENLPETHQFLKELREHLDENFSNRMLLSEANQWPEDAAAYFGDGDETNMAFHFPLMPRMFMAIQMEDRFPIIDILEQTPSIPENCQWVLFLRNHDELTLEMVTDEERDYMYRVYTHDPLMRINLGIRRRLAPLLGNDMRKIKLMKALLLTLPGTPVLYYGDEIGMGDNYYLGDRDGVRTPMQWSPDRNAGFSKADPRKLYLPVIIDPIFHYEAVNVENEEKNPSSLLWWLKYLISIRKNFKSLGRGSTELLFPDNQKVLVFIRQYQEEIIIVAANLSRQPQPVFLDLSKYSGRIPQEVFSKNTFPPIEKSPYFLTLNPYGFFMFTLIEEESKREERTPELRSTSWKKFVGSREIKKLEKALPAYLKECRWFAGQSRVIQNVEIMDSIPINNSAVLLVKINYTEGLGETYQIPLSFIHSSEEKVERSADQPKCLIALFRTEKGQGYIVDGVYDGKFRKDLFALASQEKTLKGQEGEMITHLSPNFGKFKRVKGLPAESRLFESQKSNSPILFEDKFFMKLFRRIDEGVNPDLEIGAFLTERTGFKHSPSFLGSIEYRTDSKRLILGILQGYVPHEGEAWEHMVDAVKQYFEQVLSRITEIAPRFPSSLLEVSINTIPLPMHELIGGVYLEMAHLLGQRTGEMHAALTSSNEPDFSPESFSILYQRSLYQSMRGLARRTTEFLGKKVKDLPQDVQVEAGEFFPLEQEILDCMCCVLTKKFSAKKIRIHGDYHLGQVLYTGDDFVIFDFEGEPVRALSERRLKHSSLKDVAGMIRSFHYAAYTALYQYVRSEDVPTLKDWADLWYYYMSGVFLNSYVETVRGISLLPDNKEDLSTLLHVFLLEKAIYEINYELINRPDWVIIPLKGIKFILGEYEKHGKHR
ncbi:MAG: maltose alpha-D-glucosyltransferase [Archaeoglobaceae archaeon]